MIFPILTLLTALALASVAGWFSIVGFMTIFAAAPLAAIIMGVVTEAAKIVTTSWLYRNWEYASWKLKIPLIYFTASLMAITSMGVFGFLSKAHIEQNSGIINNSAKIEQLQYQIDKEKSKILDSERVIAQLDATVNSFLGKENGDRALAVRKSQANQRKQLRNEVTQSQQIIDDLSKEKFALESELRKVELEVGPIRYIGELLFGKQENTRENIEKAVKIFTLLLVTVLDPLAIMLLIAANQTILRIQKEKKNSIPISVNQQTVETVEPPVIVPETENIKENIVLPEEPLQEEKIQKEKKDSEFDLKKSILDIKKHIFKKTPEPEINTNIQEEIKTEPVNLEFQNDFIKKEELVLENNDNIIREIVGNGLHFLPKQLSNSPESEKLQKNKKLKE